MGTLFNSYSKRACNYSPTYRSLSQELSLCALIVARTLPLRTHCRYNSLSGHSLSLQLSLCALIVATTLPLGTLCRYNSPSGHSLSLQLSLCALIVARTLPLRTHCRKNSPSARSLSQGQSNTITITHIEASRYLKGSRFILLLPNTIIHSYHEAQAFMTP